MTLPGVYCPRCGIENGDDADNCLSCGNDLRTWRGEQPQSTPPAPEQPPGSDPGQPPPPPVRTVPPQQSPYQTAFRSPSNYLPQAIIVTVVGLFCWCIPGFTGIPAIVFASQVNAKLAAGDVAGAIQASRNAKIWCWVSFGLIMAVLVLWFVLALADPALRRVIEEQS